MCVKKKFIRFFEEENFMLLVIENIEASVPIQLLWVKVCIGASLQGKTGSPLLLFPQNQTQTSRRNNSSSFNLSLFPAALDNKAALTGPKLRLQEFTRSAWRNVTQKHCHIHVFAFFFLFCKETIGLYPFFFLLLQWSKVFPGFPV